jgi:hypothetical protein
MKNNDVPGSKDPSRRLFLSASAVAAATVPLVSQASTARAAPAGTRSLQSQSGSGLQDLLSQIDPNRIQATIQQLVAFGTRHTQSSQTDPARGIGAATAWVTQQMQAIAENANGNMTVRQQSFVQQPVPNRITAPTTITNCITTLQGNAKPERFYVVTGHLDSRVTNLLDSTSDAPGADDDGSGVACVLELARVFANSDQQFAGTIIFATVSGEEEGLFGSTFMAQQMAAAGNDVQGMFSNDIIGTGDAHDGTPPDPTTVRLFLAGIPPNMSAGDISLMQAIGGENDGLSRQLGRFVAEVAPFSLTGMNIRLIWRRDRYLRASDHVSFQGQGYPAARFTEPRENFNHEHQNTQVVDGVQLGDLIQYVDFNYVAGVTRVNAAALWAPTAARSPSRRRSHRPGPHEHGIPGLTAHNG